MHVSFMLARFKHRSIKTKNLRKEKKANFMRVRNGGGDVDHERHGIDEKGCGIATKFHFAEAMEDGQLAKALATSWERDRPAALPMPRPTLRR